MVRGPLSQAEYEAIFSRVPRLTVELVIVDPARRVLLALRETGPCAGLWHLPGGTVRFGEPAVDAVARVANDELGLDGTAGELLGYLEYPSHYERGLDSPVGLVFRVQTVDGVPEAARLHGRCAWFATLPDEIHDEQREFLAMTFGLASAAGGDGPAQA